MAVNIYIYVYSHPLQSSETSSIFITLCFSVKADQKAEEERKQRAEEERLYREEEMRDIAIKLRKR